MTIRVSKLQQKANQSSTCVDQQPALAIMLCAYCTASSFTMTIISQQGPAAKAYLKLCGVCISSMQQQVFRDLDMAFKDG